MVREEIDRRAEIIHSYFRRFHATWITAALTIVGRIESQCHITYFRELTGMKPRSLLLDTAERMTDDDGGIFLCWTIVCRKIKITDHIDQKTVVERYFLFLHTISYCHGRRFRSSGQTFALQHFV